MENIEKELVQIYSELTPNPKAIRFVTNVVIATSDASYNSIEEAKNDSLVSAIFHFPFIESVFVSPKSLTLTAKEGVEWLDVVKDVREFLKDLLKNHEIEEVSTGEKKSETTTALSHAITTNDVEKDIIATIDEYIKPAVESDGGAIYFQRFEKELGRVTVALKGACSGCPSATVTLKSGVETLLKNHFPNLVKEVVAVN